MKWIIAPLLLALAACGDIGNIQVDIQFPDDDTELKTRALEFVVREVPADRDGCLDLWSAEPSGLPENRSVVNYPNRNDVVAAPVKLSQYPTLTFLVYAHSTRDITASRAIAGGCRVTPVDAEATQEILILLEASP